jgi:hypothetical protein
MPTRPLPRHLAAGVLGAIVLAACGDETAGPSQFLLLGQWGSSAVSLVAIRAGAEVQLPCAAVIIDDPIELTGTGAFSATGRLQTSSALLGPLPEIRVSGQASGTHVSLTLPDQEAGSPVTYQLDAGVVPPPMEVPECPL